MPEFIRLFEKNYGFIINTLKRIMQIRGYNPRGASCRNTGGAIIKNRQKRASDKENNMLQKLHSFLCNTAQFSRQCKTRRGSVGSIQKQSLQSLRQNIRQRN